MERSVKKLKAKIETFIPSFRIEKKLLGMY